MKKFLAFSLSILFSLGSLFAETEFAYISSSSFNIGDDIQGIAAKRFLPENSIPIDREFVGVFQHNTAVPTILNGWFMHTKDFFWYRNDIPGPEISWPPSPSIDPLVISIHFDPRIFPYILSDQGRAFLMAHSPIGARDLFTLGVLQNNNIPCYYSACLTLTLQNPYSDEEREDVIYAVDIDAQCLNYLKANSRYEVRVMTHNVPRHLYFDNEGRLALAELLLEKYRKARAVITSRLHVALPCIAFETPVLMIGDDLYRFKGLNQLFRQCDRNQFLSGTANFDFNDPTPNPQDYVFYREQLIETVTNWVQSKQP